MRPLSIQRRMRGWQIQWIAGLFSLLMLAAGTLSANSGSNPSSTTSRAPALELDGDQIVDAERNPAFDVFLEPAAASAFERENAQDPTDASNAPSSVALRESVYARFAVLTDTRTPRSIDASGLTAPRAPPLA
jgi:hypothetical protein